MSKQKSIPVAAPHQRRVTLNLIRHAACCPEPLREALDRVADVQWDLTIAKPDDLELIFASVDPALAETAREEFEADLSSIWDLYRNPRAGNPDNNCILCGHHDIRWEFALVNKVGGRSTFTGSTCIVEYGLNIDGLGSSEAALAALQEALNRAKREADAAEWREAHPDHQAVMGEFQRMIEFAAANAVPSDWRMWRHLRPQWKKRALAFKTKANKVAGYYRQNQCLTKLQTSKVYGKGPGSFDAEGRALRAEWDAAVVKVGGAR